VLLSAFDEAPVDRERHVTLPSAANAAHQRRADAANTEHIYPDRALAACACYALGTNLFVFANA
jgi:hypothetical protein